MKSGGRPSPVVDHPSTADARWMAEALALARRGLGRTHPNPAVGALLVKAGRVIGRGWHKRAGEPHAEIVALREAGGRAKGATLYCTLEPCTLLGRTPPCVDAVLEAGVQRVVVGTTDPNPRVRGRGLRRLRSKGLEILSGVEEEAARELIRGFASVMRRGRPWVRLKLASSLDGRIATASGESRWITGREARAMVHDWRNEFDAVAVGSGTALVDDPRLTCRQRGGRDPLRLVFDRRLRLRAGARLLSAGRSPVWVLTDGSGGPRRARRLEAAGARVLEVCPVPGEGWLEKVLGELARQGVTSLLVEGGAALAGALIRADCVDEIALFLAPLLIGADGVPIINGMDVTRLAAAPLFQPASVERIGQDVLLRLQRRKGRPS